MLEIKLFARRLAKSSMELYYEYNYKEDRLL
jgi:hypothetical protein